MSVASRLATTLGLALAAVAIWAGAASAATFSNTAQIAIPSIGTATPYPSQITVSGEPFPIVDLNVNLNGFTHNAPADVQGPLLVGPGGQALLLMGCVGGDGSPYPGASNVNLKLDDSSGIQLPGYPGTVTSGTFKPTNYCGPLPSFPSPGPLTSYGNPGPGAGGTATLASTFNGASANGTWSLFVQDAFSGETGQFAGGWSLEINPLIIDGRVGKKKCKKGFKLKKIKKKGKKPRKKCVRVKKKK